MDEIDEIDLSVLTKEQQSGEIAKYWFELECVNVGVWFNTGLS